jgi:predicted SAM-dependent methyltransferase
LRINVLFDGASPRPGYVNARLGENVQGVDFGEAEEIVADGVLDCVPVDELGGVLASCCRLLAPGGTLRLSFTELYEVATAICEYNLSPGEANAVLRGHGGAKAWTHDLRGVREILRKLGMKVVQVKLEHYEAHVVARRDA